MERLVELQSTFNDEKCLDIVVTCAISPQHYTESQDWVGLYRTNFEDYR